MSFLAPSAIEGRPYLNEVAAEGELAAFMRERRPETHSEWAWDNYDAVILALSQRFGLKRLCEIGGGRDPLFRRAQIDALGLDFVVNDIDAGELAHAPSDLRTACFDIAGDLSEPDARRGGFDLMFSRMVFEHVDGVPRAWANIHELLAPGGVALCFFPTLWNPIFAVNHLLPEPVSRAIVKALYPARRDDGIAPKFPALYDHCRSDERIMRPMLRRAGFSDIHLQPFWGSEYFNRIPVVREVDAVFNRLAAGIDWRLMTTYAYVMVRKAS